MPDDDGQFARDRDGRDVGAASPCDALVEGPQRSGSADRLPRRFDQHGPGMGAALLGDPPVPRPAVAGLMHARVQAEIGDQLVGAGEALDRADRRHQADRDHHVDARNGHEPLDVRVGERVARELALDDPQVVGEPVVLAQMPLHRILSSAGSGCASSQARPLGPSRSACGHGGTRWACRIDWMIVFSRARWRTIWLRRVTCRRRPSVRSSGTQTSGRKPLA